MAEKSPNARRLNSIQLGLQTLLVPLGFRSRGRTLSRAVDADMLQIIGLQAGSFELGQPLAAEWAHLRPSFYGKFTINLGVYVPEVYERTMPPAKPRAIITDASCSIRARLGELVTGHDVWWSLDDSESLIAPLGEMLLEAGIPFLDRFASRDAILREWVSFNDTEMSLAPSARLDVAMVMMKRGDREAAKAMLVEHLVHGGFHQSQEPYVRELAAKLGLGALD